MKALCLLAFASMNLGGSLSAQSSRTDINPALLYYQAFLVAPELSADDRNYLFANDWHGKALPDRFGRLMQSYDVQFRLVSQAARAKPPCDWGIDMSLGPGTILPHLARNRGIAEAARWRVVWEFQQGRQEQARETLLGALALGRNCSRDGTLISALVQIAVERIVCASIAENYSRFTGETAKELGEGMEAGPVRGTLAACIPLEKQYFLDWFLERIAALQKQNPGDDGKVMAGIRDLFAAFDVPEEGPSSSPPPNHWEDVVKASGGTSRGVVKLLHDEEPLYRRAAEILALPEKPFEDEIRKFTADIQESRNPLVRLAFPAIAKVRPKEFAVLAQLAMVQAAIAYKLDGKAGLNRVQDPYGTGPFVFQRFMFKGVDRGFELTSAYAGRGFPEVLIFVEKDGLAFQVSGKDAGQAVTSEPAAK